MVGACLGLSFVNTGLRDQNLRAVGEVTAVVDGARPGTVVVHTKRRALTTGWLVDDTGDPVDRASGDDELQGGPRTQDCVGTVCYRVTTTALRVEASSDGGKTYSVAWEVGGETYTMLAESYPEVGNPAEHLSSRSVVVHAVAGGHVVFVANGRDGLLHRDVHGAWLRLGSPASGEGCCYYEPPLRIASDPQPLDLTIYAVSVVVVAILLSGGITAMIRRKLRWFGVLAVIVLAALAAYGTELAGHFPTVGMFPGFVYGGPLILVTLVGGVALAAWFIGGPPTRRSGPANGPAAPVVAPAPPP
jgi:hypothetical protein